MDSRLRSLERLLVCQRSEVRITPVVAAFVDSWQRAVEQNNPLPDPLDLLQAVIGVGVMPLAFGPVAAYLDQCRSARRVPDPSNLIAAIIHGHTDRRSPSRPQCHCLARRDLAGAL